jgi:hypothetical protein
VGMVAAASVIAAISVRGGGADSDGKGAASRGAVGRGGGSPLSLAALLASSLGFAPTAAGASAYYSMPPGLRWLVPDEDDSPLPGEGLVVLALALLAVSIIYAYPSPHGGWGLFGRRRRGKGQGPGEVRACVRACVRA